MTEGHPVAEADGLAKARTLAEAYAFVELSLPLGEEWVDFARLTSLHRLGDSYLLRFDGPYQGRRHIIEVAVPVPDGNAPDEPRLSYGEGRSTLVDAGQWCLLELSAAEVARAGLLRLDGAPPDDETYRAIYGAWDAARAAADEVAKFLPPSEGPGSSEDPERDEMPASACWTELGQWLRAERPELLRRSRIDAARADHQRRLADFVTRYDLPDPLAEPPVPDTDPPGPAGGVPAEVAGDVEVIPVRTFAEAHLYLDLHPCVCGCALFPRGRVDVVRSDAAELVVRCAGPCDECGRPRNFVLRLPQRPGVPADSPYRFSHPGDGPSEAIDAGQWLGVAEGNRLLLEALGVEQQPEDPDEPGPTWPVDREEIVRLLVGAASALDEALKFLPPGAATIPAHALWTVDGREHQQRLPGQFDRDRLTAERDRRWRRLTGYLDRYGR